MNNEKIIQLLRRRRHDDLNELQLIKAFIEMNRYEQLKEKFDEFIEKILLEQRLFNLNIPQFSLFLLQFNHDHCNIKLTYHIPMMQIDLSRIDDDLYLIGNTISSFMKQFLCQWTEYELNILFSNVQNGKDELKISFEISSLTNKERSKLRAIIDEKLNHLIMTCDVADNNFIIQTFLHKEK